MSGNRQIVCPGCGAVNRVPADKPADAGKCGKCGNVLFSGKPLNVDTGMFSRQTGRSDIPVGPDIDRGFLRIDIDRRCSSPGDDGIFAGP